MSYETLRLRLQAARIAELERDKEELLQQIALIDSNTVPAMQWRDLHEENQRLRLFADALIKAGSEEAMLQVVEKYHQALADLPAAEEPIRALGQLPKLDLMDGHWPDQTAMQPDAAEEPALPIGEVVKRLVETIRTEWYKAPHTREWWEAVAIARTTPYWQKAAAEEPKPRAPSAPVPFLYGPGFEDGLSAPTPEEPEPEGDAWQARKCSGCGRFQDPMCHYCPGCGRNQMIDEEQPDSTPEDEPQEKDPSDG